jgi:hypothetical protein
MPDGASDDVPVRDFHSDGHALRARTTSAAAVGRRSSTAYAQSARAAAHRSISDDSGVALSPWTMALRPEDRSIATLARVNAVASACRVVLSNDCGARGRLPHCAM